MDVWGEASMADVQTTMVELYNRGNEYNYNINGLYPYAGQGFEGNLTNQAYMTSGKGIGPMLVLPTQSLFTHKNNL